MGDYLNDQSKNTSESWCPRCASLECASCVAGWRQRATEMGCQTSDTKATRSLPCADAALGQAVQPTSVRPDRSPIGIIVRASVELRALLAVLAAQSEWLCSRRLLFCWTIQARSRLGECAAPSFGSRPSQPLRLVPQCESLLETSRVPPSSPYGGRRWTRQGLRVRTSDACSTGWISVFGPPQRSRGFCRASDACLARVGDMPPSATPHPTASARRAVEILPPACCGICVSYRRGRSSDTHAPACTDGGTTQ